MKNYIKSILIIGLFLSSQISFATESCSYKVTKVQSPDTLTIRSQAGKQFKKVGSISATGNGIEIIGAEKQIRNSKWVPIKYNNIYGWVNRGYLKEDCPVENENNANKLFHVVQSGETLYSIARQYHYSHQQIARWNNLEVGDQIIVGQRLWISPPYASTSMSLQSRGGNRNCSTYKVVNVKADDYLAVRSGAGVKNKILFALPANANQIEITGNAKTVGRSKWVPIKYLKMEAWVNRRFLAEDC
jgi:LysM repeat protein